MEAVTAINAPSHSNERNLWSSLVEAVRGSHQDYTTGNVNRAILLLAVPMVLEMVLGSLFAGGDIFWSSLVEAVRGSHQDYTTGNVNRAILLLAVPMVLEMVLESLFAVVDVFWVGRLGANAVATVGLTESLLSLVFAIGLGLSLSTTAMVARRIGEKDPEDAAIAGVQAVVLGLSISLALGIPAGIYAPELLRAV